MLIDSGVDDSIISEQMGHADISTTRKYYYFSRKSKIDKIKAIEAAVKI
jgi:integrase